MKGWRRARELAALVESVEAASTWTVEPLHESAEPLLGGGLVPFCAWFAGCQYAATTCVDHPILGAVPACQRCAELAAL